MNYLFNMSIHGNDPWDIKQNVDKFLGNDEIIVLQNTSKFGDNDPISKYFADPDIRSSTTQRGVFSVLGSAITQQRAVFGIKKDKVGTLVRNDPNWGEKNTFDNDHYRAVIKVLCENYCEEVHKGSGKQLSIYKITHPEILKEFDVDVEKQTDEALNFVAKRGPVNKPVGKSVTVDRSKKIADSSKLSADSSKKKKEVSFMAGASRSKASAHPQKERKNSMGRPGAIEPVGVLTRKELFMGGK